MRLARVFPNTRGRVRDFGRVHSLRVLVRTFCFNFWSKNLLAAIHAGDLINAVWETEILALFILHDIRFNERVMRPSVIGVAPRMAHAD